MAGEKGPNGDLRELYDGDYERFIEESTGMTPDELRAMAFPERQAILATLGVNIKNLKTNSQGVSERNTYHNG